MRTRATTTTTTTRRRALALGAGLGLALGAGALLGGLLGEPPAAPPSPSAIARPSAPARPAAPTVALAPPRAAAPAPAAALARPRPPAPAAPTAGAAAPAPARRLEVLVVDEAGAPVAGARVAARPAGGGPVAGALADAAGRVALEVPAGALEVMAVAAGFRVPEAPRPAAPDAASLEVRLVREGPPAATLDAPPGAPPTVHALVVDEGGRPAPGAAVEVELEGGVARATADAAGALALALPAGAPATLTASAPGRASARRAVVAPARVVLHLEPLARVEAAAFRGPDGRPVRGHLQVDPGAGDPHDAAAPPRAVEAAFDAAGVPTLAALPPGRWTLSFLEPAPGELRAWVRDVEAAPGAPLALTFDGSAPRGRVAGRLRGAPLAGQGAGAGGADLVQVDVRPAAAPADAFGFVAARPVDPDGAFALDAVPPGRYRVRASWDGGASGEVEVEVAAGAEAWAELLAE